MPGQQRTSGLGFFTMVGLVMGGLKLKERWDEYRQVPSDEEGRVALTETNDGAPQDSEERERLLLDTELPTPARRTRKKSCCVCCGMDCGLFWKAFGIVLGLAILYNLIQFIVWVVTPSPTGLEDMPAYSTSLGCLDAPHIFNGSMTTYQIRPDGEFRHKVDIRGSGVGTFVIKSSTSDSSEIRYEMTLRTTDESLLDQVTVQLPEDGDDKSHVTFFTPIPDINAVEDCSRFDITMYVPRTLKTLVITSHSVTHLLFDADDTNINMDKLAVTLYAPNTNNQILPHVGLHATKLVLEAFRGWIVGEVSVVEEAEIKTQQGDANVNIKAKVLPYKSMDAELPVAELRTVTGGGRTDVFVSSDKGFPHRKINAHHLSSRNGDMYLTYRDAEFNGRVSLDSKSYSAKGLHPLPKADESTDGAYWTHSVGDANGGDQLKVTSRGWTGLYFY